MPALIKRLMIGLLLIAGANAQAPTPAAAPATQAAPAATASCDMPRGKDVYQMCSACHSLTAKESAREGPSLAGLFGRKAGGQAGFAYSGPMRSAGWQWTPALLDSFLANPRRAVRGTTMTFNGVKDAAERAAVVCYIAAEIGS
jgi:cytochrome c